MSIEQKDEFKHIILAPLYSDVNNTPLSEVEVHRYVHDPRFLVDIELLFRSDVIKDSIESGLEKVTNGDGDFTKLEILQVDVLNDTLLDIIEYLRLPVIDGNEINKPLKNANLFENTTNKLAVTYIDSIHTSNVRLFDLISKANQLGIKDLVEVGCAKVASMIKGQPIEILGDILKTDNKKK
jgi:hypothetical protein